MGLFHSVGKFFSSTIGSFALLALSLTPLTSFALGYKIAAVAVAIAGSYAAAKYQQSLLKQSFKDVSGGGYLVNTRSPSKELPVVYGRCRVGINWIWAATSGNNNEYLYIVGSLCEGPIEAVEELWLDGKPLPGVRDVERSDIKVVKQITNPSINKVRLKIDTPHYTCYDWSQECYFEGHNTATFEVSRGETLDLTTLKISFAEDGTITVEGKPIDSVCVKWGWEFDEWGGLEKVCEKTKAIYQSINSVSITEFSTDGGETWFNSPDDLVVWDWVAGGEDNFSSKSGGLFDEIRNLGFTDNVPYTACVVVRLKWATQKVDNVIQPRWSGIPNITAVVRGRVVDDLGTGFKGDNPALALYDFLTNSRYGLGISPEKMDVESFKEVALFCHEQGFSFNGPIYDGSAKDVVELFCNHFRGLLIKSFGKFKLRYKHLALELPVMKFSDEDFIEGSFSYSMPSRTKTPNAIEVEYVDPVMNDTPQTLTLEVPDEISTEESPIQIKLFGVDRLGAKRLGAYFLERARLNHTISFTTTTKALPLEPGDVIEVSYEQWGIKEKLFRVEEVRQIDEDTVSVSAVLEDIRLYNEDLDLDVRTIDLTTVPSPDEPPAVVIPTLSEDTELDKDGTPMTYVVVSWEVAGGLVDSYEVWVNENGKGWELSGITKAPPYRILVRAGKSYSVKIVPVSIFGIKPDWDAVPEASITVAGITEGPGFTGGISVSVDNAHKVAVLRWAKVTDKDFDHYEVKVYDQGSGELLDEFFTSTNSMTIKLKYNGPVRIGVVAVNTSGVTSQEFSVNLNATSPYTYPGDFSHLACCGNGLILKPFNALNSYPKYQTPLRLTRDFFYEVNLGLSVGNVSTDQINGKGYYFDAVCPYDDANHTCKLYGFSLSGDLILLKEIPLPKADVEPLYRTENSPLRVKAWADFCGNSIWLAYMTPYDSNNDQFQIVILKDEVEVNKLTISGRPPVNSPFIFAFPGDAYLVGYIDGLDGDKLKVWSSQTGSWHIGAVSAGTGNVFPQKLTNGLFYKTNDANLDPVEQYRKVSLDLSESFIAPADHYRSYNPYERAWYIADASGLKRALEDGTVEEWWALEWDV